MDAVAHHNSRTAGPKHAAVRPLMGMISRLYPAAEAEVEAGGSSKIAGTQ